VAFQIHWFGVVLGGIRMQVWTQLYWLLRRQFLILERSPSLTLGRFIPVCINLWLFVLLYS
jgi:hypothetical protein